MMYETKAFFPAAFSSANLVSIRVMGLAVLPAAFRRVWRKARAEINAWLDLAPPDPRTCPQFTGLERVSDGLQDGYRRHAQCRQIDAVQRAHPDRGSAGGKLSLLHHRAERGRGRGARRPARPAGGDRAVETDRAHAHNFRRYRRPGEGRLAGARALATNSWRISARSTPSPMFCAVSKTTTSRMSRVASTPSPMPTVIETELMLADLDGIEKRRAGPASASSRAATRTPRRPTDCWSWRRQRLRTASPRAPSRSTPTISRRGGCCNC